MLLVFFWIVHLWLPLRYSLTFNIYLLWPRLSTEGPSWSWSWLLNLWLAMQSVSITNNVVSSNPLRRGLHDTPLCDEVCLWLATGRRFCSGTPVSSTNKPDRHDITEILLNVALNTITLTLTRTLYLCLKTDHFLYNNIWSSRLHNYI